jgi:hypothetical protein
MAKTGQDATIYRKNRVTLRFQVLDEDTVGEPPLNISGFVVKYAVARLSEDGVPIVATPLIDWRSDVQTTKVVLVTPVSGIVEVRMLAADNDVLPPKDYWHELEVFDGSGEPVVAMTGTLTVLPNVVNV